MNAELQPVQEETTMRHDKISPGLALAMEDYEKEGHAGLQRHARTLGFVPTASDLEPPRLPVFLYCAEASEIWNLEGLGVQVNQVSGRVRTALAPLESIPGLAERPEIERVVASHYLRPLIDAASVRCNLSSFRTRRPLTGRGTLIGVIDTGIDTKHSAFRGRIHSIWDQTLTGSGVPEAGFGRELKGLQLAKSRDTDGHGTHVAGIAAGSHPAFGGIAPEATLVVVKTDFNDAHIADGIRYIQRIGREQGLPTVINLSLGGHNDPHDGTDPLSTLIDQVSGSGCVICCAAGNEGDDNIHAQVVIPPGSERSIRFRIPTDTVNGVLLTGWYPGDNLLEVSVRTPSGFFTPFQGVAPAGTKFTRLHPLPEASISVATPDVNPDNGDHTFRVSLGSPTGGALKGGVWRLVVRNTSTTSAQLDVWTIDGLPSPEVVFSGTSASDSMKIGSPGSAASAITVASYTTRVEWTDVDGVFRQVALGLDDISSFSSEGPLRNGAHKPDLAAPGAMLVSCRSAASSPDRTLMIDDEFHAQGGTSMATPFIAGLVSLLLEDDPTLDPSQVKSLLMAQTTIPSPPGGTFHPKWGAGLIDTNAL